MAAFFFLPKQSQSLVRSYFDPCCFLRSAQRFRMASAMRFRPSGDRRRLRLPVFAAGEAVFFAAAAALGRPGPRFAESPVKKARACCSREISESISFTIRLKSTVPPVFIPTLICITPASQQFRFAETMDSITIQLFLTIRQTFRDSNWKGTRGLYPPRKI